MRLIHIPAQYCVPDKSYTVGHAPDAADSIHRTGLGENAQTWSRLGYVAPEARFDIQGLVVLPGDRISCCAA